MNFTKYTSIENSYRAKFIEHIMMQGFSNVDWVVTEKIHGANFSFYYDGNEHKVASRNQFVDGAFYNCKEVVEKHIKPIEDLYKLSGAVEHIRVTGELYGSGIQSIAYGEKNFRAFELEVDGKIMNHKKLTNLLQLAGILQVPVINVHDSLSSALTEANEFDSFINQSVRAEGLVLQPAEPAWLANGSRVILKNKSEVFTEKKVRKPKVKVEDDPIIEQYITQGRLESVLSKLGEITPKDFGTVIGLMSKDITEDMKKDAIHVTNGKQISKQVASFLRLTLLPNL